jgi:hypothetical protein
MVMPGDLHQGACPRAIDRELGVDRLRPPAHRCETHALALRGVMGGIRGEPCAIVGNDELHPIRRDGGPDPDRGAARMAHRVADGLRRNPEHRELDIGRRPSVRREPSVVDDLGGHRDRARARLLGEIVQGGRQAQVVENGRPEVRRHVAEVAGEGSQVLALGLGAGQDLEPPDNRDELLERHVVQLPREPGPFCFGGLGGGGLANVAEDCILERLADPAPGRGQHHGDGEEHRNNNQRRGRERVHQHEADDGERGDDGDVEQPWPHQADRLPSQDRNHGPIREERECARERECRADTFQSGERLRIGEPSNGPGEDEEDERGKECDPEGHCQRNAAADVDRGDDRSPGHDDRRQVWAALKSEWDAGGQERERGRRDDPPAAGREEQHGQAGKPEGDEADRERRGDAGVGTCAQDEVGGPGCVVRDHLPAAWLSGGDEAIDLIARTNANAPGEPGRADGEHLGPRVIEGDTVVRDSLQGHRGG